MDGCSKSVEQKATFPGLDANHMENHHIKEATFSSPFDLLNASELRPKLHSFAEIFQALGTMIQVIILAKVQKLQFYPEISKKLSIWGFFITKTKYKIFPVDSCDLTSCHISPESTTTCCGGEKSKSVKWVKTRR